MIDVVDFRRVIRSTLSAVGLWSDWSENLLLGTALQESRLTYLKQRNRGPALGVYQMEPATHNDIWSNWLRYRLSMNQKARKFSEQMLIPGTPRPGAAQLEWNLAYATVMCRLHYYRASFVIPDPHDYEALARIWKWEYNTVSGRGTVAEFVTTWERYAR